MRNFNVVGVCYLQIAASGNRDMWLAWIDALIAFEGSLGRSGLLGCYWDVGADASDLPVLLLRGSTLSVLGENPAWMVSTSLWCNSSCARSQQTHRLAWYNVHWQ